MKIWPIDKVIRVTKNFSKNPIAYSSSCIAVLISLVIEKRLGIKTRGYFLPKNEINLYDDATAYAATSYPRLKKMISEPDISIVIVSYNDQEMLAGCLDSASRNSQGLRLKTIVINNGYPPLPSNLKERFPDILWRENNKNLGFARAANQGIKLARAKYILCLNSDTTLLAESLSPLVKFMNEHNEAGAAGGRILNPDGIVQPTCRRFPTYLTALFNRTSLLTRLFPNNRFSKRYLLSNWNHENIRRVDWVCGAYIIFRREAFMDVGYLDENYFLYCEDIDWCYRAKRKGWKIYYVPQAKLIHSCRSDRYTGKKIIQHHKSMYRFYRQYLKVPLAFRVLIASAIFLRVVWTILLLYCLRILLNSLHKTLNVAEKSLIIKD